MLLDSAFPLINITILEVYKRDAQMKLEMSGYIAPGPCLPSTNHAALSTPRWLAGKRGFRVGPHAALDEAVQDHWF